VAIDHYAPKEVAALRAEFPRHFIVEVATPGATCLIAVPDSAANRAQSFCAMPIDFIDNTTLYSKPLPADKAAA
jgi:hypothetical protein